MSRKNNTQTIIIGILAICGLMLCKSCVTENLVYKSSNITIKNNHKESADSASINLRGEAK